MPISGIDVVAECVGNLVSGAGGSVHPEEFVLREASGESFSDEVRS